MGIEEIIEIIHSLSVWEMVRIYGASTIKLLPAIGIIFITVAALFTLVYFLLMRLK